MASQHTMLARPTLGLGIRSWQWLGFLVVAVAAIVPRFASLGLFLNGDEALFWFARSQAFWDALRSGNYGATAISTHPGVITMWLGGAGMLLRDWAFGSGLVRDYSYQTSLALVRTPLELTHVFAVVLGYGLLRRLLPLFAAFLAALVWALDPFVVAYSRILHVDALAGSFLTLSMLAACVFWIEARQVRWLILSGVAGGLAILSKSPALSLVTGVGLVALLDALWINQTRAADRLFAQRLWVFCWPLLVWALACGVTIVALWPVMWVGPLAAYDQIRIGVQAEGARPHQWGNYFLNEEDDAPGFQYYPVVLALRLTPITTLGMLVLPLALWPAVRSARREADTSTTPLRSAAAIAGYVIMFVLAMSMFPKKLNRYLVPVFPLIDMLAALGLAWLCSVLASRWRRRAATIRATLAATVVIGAVGVLAWWHPYEMLAFNQLFGGAQVGARAFTLGTGEGMNEVADWLNQQPDIADVLVASPMVNTLQPFLRKGGQTVAPDGSLPQGSGYVVVYVRQTQHDQLNAPFDAFYGKETPQHTVTLHGIEYAWIYRVPPAVAVASTADVGTALRLRGFTQDTPAQPGQPLLVQLVWHVREQPASDLMLFVHVLDASGAVVARADLPQPTSTWAANSDVPIQVGAPLPETLPPGTYQFVIGLYDPATGQRLPLGNVAAEQRANDGPEALLLTTVEVQK